MGDVKGGWRGDREINKVNKMEREFFSYLLILFPFHELKEIGRCQRGMKERQRDKQSKQDGKRVSFSNFLILCHSLLIVIFSSFSKFPRHSDTTIDGRTDRGYPDPHTGKAISGLLYSHT